MRSIELYYFTLDFIKFRSFMNLYDILFQRGLIGYGKTIHISILEDLIGHKFEEGWPFLGPYLRLRDELHENGYFTSSRRQVKSSIHILPREQMHVKYYNDTKRNIKKQKRSNEAVYDVDVSDLDDEIQDRHYHTLNKARNMINAAKSIIDKYLD